jgi:hypothetical protein
MKKLEISLTDEQYEKLSNSIRHGAEINLQEETFSGFTISLCVTEANISWLELEMGNVIKLGEVDWDIC